MTDRKARRAEHFYGRRKGKPLRPSQAHALDAMLADRGIDLDAPPPADVRALFSRPVDEVRLEIGFGGGEHLLHRARSMPSSGFIGVEPFVNGLAKAAAALAEDDRELVPRVRLHGDDATGLLEWLPAACLAGVDVLYPDPWPKPRHWKRRFLDDRRLGEIVRVLRPHGQFRFASDIPSYVDWVLERVRRQPALQWTADAADDWRRPFDGWPGTRYEAKAVRAGRVPAYFTFRKTG